MTKGKYLRDKMAAAGLVHVMASHSPLSALLAQEAGFDAVWASGFELSALFGLADASLISMTQHLDMVRAMAQQSSLPVVAAYRIATCFSTGRGWYWGCFVISDSFSPRVSWSRVALSRSPANWAKAASERY